MPEVPYTPYPTVQPTEKATPHISVSTPGAAFGVDVAEAFANVGKNVTHVGDEIFTRALALQKLENQASAKEAEADYTIELGKLHAQYNSLQGKAAVDAYPKYAEDIQNLRVKIGSRLGNDTSQKMYDGETRGIASRTIFNGAGYAATQNKKYLFGASQARVASIQDRFYQNPGSELEIRRAEGSLQVEMAQQGDIAGWSPEQAEEEYKKASSGMLSKMILGIARYEPNKAQEMFDKYKDKLHYDDPQKVKDFIEGRSLSVGSRVIADRVFQKVYDEGEGRTAVTLQSLLDEATKIAEREFPGSKLAPESARDAVRLRWGKHGAEVRDYEFRNYSKIGTAIAGDFNGGKRPTSEDELLAGGDDVKAAWYSLKPSQREGYLKALQKNFKEDPETRGRIATLTGMEFLDKEKFTSINMWDEKIPYEDQQRLFKRQLQLYDKNEKNPLVNHALGVLQRTMPSDFPKKSVDETRYYQFGGAVAEAMRRYQEIYLKPMPDAEIQKLGAQLLQNVPGTGWFSSDKVFEHIPKEIDKQIRASPIWAERGQEPSDDAVRKVYQEMLAKKLYQKDVARPPATEAPAPTKPSKPTSSGITYEKPPAAQ